MPTGDKRILALLEQTRRIGTWSVDVHASTCWWSETTYAIHEEDPAKTIRVENAVDYYVPEHRPIIQAHVQRAVEEGVNWDVELQILTAQGNILWVRAIGAVVVEDGVVSKLYGAFEDIDARKRLEAEREEMLTLQLEGERVAKLGHWKSSLRTKLVEWTPGAYAIFGFDEAAGPPTFRRCLERVHSEDRERFQRETADAVKSLVPAALSFRIVVGGDIRHLEVRSVPQFDLSGKLRSFHGTIIDESESVVARQRHDDLRRRLSFALEAAHIGAWDWDLNTNELIWDEQMYRLHGIEESHFDGAYVAWERALHPDDRDAAIAAAQQAVEQKSRFDTQFRVVWPCGEVKVMRGIARVQLDAKGEPARMVGVNWDITELAHNRQELQRSNEELAQLAYRASHDLKAPLTTIKRLADYVGEDIVEGRIQQATKDLKTIGRQAASLEDLVLGILENARGDLDATTREQVEFKSLVSEICESLESSRVDKGVVIHTEVNTTRSYLFSKVRLYQLLTNLVSNALRYSDPAREDRFVRIEVSETDSELLLVVSDNGLGIPAGSEKSIYEMFRTLHPAGLAGSGLGLYVVHKHVEALSGSICFESSRAGTSFTVQFPWTLT